MLGFRYCILYLPRQGRPFVDISAAGFVMSCLCFKTPTL
nr:MAG TPA_asm: hypothetical protein [Bacteriophage sp.]